MKTDAIDPEVAEPSAPAIPDPKAPIPRQIRYIIGNEGCERFSFYGMKSILAGYIAGETLEVNGGQLML